MPPISPHTFSSPVDRRPGVCCTGWGSGGGRSPGARTGRDRHRTGPRPPRPPGQTRSKSGGKRRGSCSGACRRNVYNQSLCMSCHEGWWSKVLNNYGIKTWLQSFFKRTHKRLLTVAKQSPQCADLLLDYFGTKKTWEGRRRMKFNLKSGFLKPHDIDSITFSRRGRWWCMRQGWSDRRQPLSQTSGAGRDQGMR